jgi:hypothetical protein
MKKSIPILLFAFLIHSSGFSQTCGNPAGTMGEGQWTTALNGTYQTLNHGKQTFESKRVFFKASYGFSPYLDVYGLIGGTKVAMKNHDAAISDFKDRSRLAYGAGFTVLANPAPSKPGRSIRRPAGAGPQTRIGFWGGASIIRYPAEAVYDRSNDLVVHEYKWKHDCREMTAHAGIIVPYKSLKLYWGVVGWAIQRLDTKNEYLLGITAEPIHKGTAKATFQSGLWTGGLAGIQVGLPQNYSLTVEAIAFNKKYYQIMIGISQTGIRVW